MVGLSVSERVSDHVLVRELVVVGLYDWVRVDDSDPVEDTSGDDVSELDVVRGDVSDGDNGGAGVMVL
jgi:hypothetical protein